MPLPLLYASLWHVQETGFCPCCFLHPELHDHCDLDWLQLYTGGSIGGAVKLNYRNADVVMNWMGGLHHAKKAEARPPCHARFRFLQSAIPGQHLLREQPLCAYSGARAHAGLGVLLHQ